MSRVAATRLIAADRQAIWALLSDVQNATRWNKAWSAIELTTRQTHGKGTRFRARTDDDHTFEFEVCDWSAPERISFCPVREPHEMYSITLDSHTFELRPAGEQGAEVTLIASARAAGIRGRIYALFFWPNHQRPGLEAALDALQGVFEPETLLKPDAPEPLPE